MATQLLGRGLMLALSGFFWLYVFRPNLPLVRGLAWWYRLPPGDPIVRASYGIVGTIFIVGALLV